MDIDFHFSTVYVLCRWAGFEEYTAKVIASASQFVDDNVHDIIPNNACRTSGHKAWSNAFDWKNNNEVWIPFHFLPGLDGDTWEARMTCKKNSSLSKALAERILSFNINSNDGVLLLGISLHVYADTWAHREFKGFIDDGNKISNPKILFPEDNLIDFCEDSILSNLIPLGHAQAIHWPDRPYAKWQCEPIFSYGRENWEEFLEAARAIYNILSKLKTGMVEDLTKHQEKLLTDTFKEIQISDCEKRNKNWVNKINQGDFEFAGESELEYATGFILADNDYQKEFYKALDAHYDWVKEQLETEGLQFLK